MLLNVYNGVFFIKIIIVIKVWFIMGRIISFWLKIFVFLIIGIWIEFGYFMLLS